MSSTLHTLKARPFQEQIRIIERLTEQNLDLYEEIRFLLEACSEDSVIRISVSGNRHKVVRVALLAVVAVEIVTIPDQLARKPYEDRLEELCSYFAIDSRDLSVMIQYASQIEGSLVDWV